MASRVVCERGKGYLIHAEPSPRPCANGHEYGRNRVHLGWHACHCPPAATPPWAGTAPGRALPAAIVQQLAAAPGRIALMQRWNAARADLATAGAGLIHAGQVTF